MPYSKIKSGKNKGKYRNKENGSIRTLKQIQAYHAKKRKGK
jgi:hypothetical protein